MRCVRNIEQVHAHRHGHLLHHYRQHDARWVKEKKKKRPTNAKTIYRHRHHFPWDIDRSAGCHLEIGKWSTAIASIWIEMGRMDRAHFTIFISIMDTASASSAVPILFPQIWISISAFASPMIPETNANWELWLMPVKSYAFFQDQCIAKCINWKFQ